MSAIISLKKPTARVSIALSVKLIDVGDNLSFSAECLRAGTFEGKNPCPVEASTSIQLSIYTNNPIQINS
jgi:hypothetical protein